MAIDPQRLVYLTAGAAGMYCGSCMHDNTLARALLGEGWDVQLVPTYTPIRTDETNVSVDQVFFGGINIYLQQKVPLLRYVPRFLDRFLDNPSLIRRVTAKAGETDPRLLGELTTSMLKGTAGHQRKEVKRLCRWLGDTRPDLIVFTNALIGGCIPEIKRQFQTPVIVTLQGDDVFLDFLPAEFRRTCLDQIRTIADQVDAFVAHSEFYRDYMGDYLGIPTEKIHVTPLGLNVDDFAELQDRPFVERYPVIGYLARLAPEKGLDHLIDAFLELKRNPAFAETRLKLAGWLGEEHRAFAEEQLKRLDEAGWQDHYEYLGAIDRGQKVQFLESIDLLCVPTRFLEPKGLYALEALAAGVPILKPDHGCFPELIRASGGGQLFKANNPRALARALSELLADRSALHALGKTGQEYVLKERNAQAMAESTSALFRQYARPREN